MDMEDNEPAENEPAPYSHCFSDTAARKAYYFVMDQGLWINLADAGIVPSLENSINQLQELYQKKYLEDKLNMSLKNCRKIAGDVTASAVARTAMAIRRCRQQDRR